MIRLSSGFLLYYKRQLPIVAGLRGHETFENLVDGVDSVEGPGLPENRDALREEPILTNKPAPSGSELLVLLLRTIEAAEKCT